MDVNPSRLAWTPLRPSSTRTRPSIALDLLALALDRDSERTPQRVRRKAESRKRLSVLAKAFLQGITIILPRRRRAPSRPRALRMHAATPCPPAPCNRLRQGLHSSEHFTLRMPETHAAFSAGVAALCASRMTTRARTSRRRSESWTLEGSS